LPKAGGRNIDVIILASTSSTRQSMLANAGVNFTVVGPRVDEAQLLEENPAWTPSDASLHLARAKAMEVSGRNTNKLVIGADQVLSLAERTYSKPSNFEAARSQLRDLRGKTHELISSAVCTRDGSELWNVTRRAQMKMRNWV
jgi:septum formation protein